MLPVASTYVYPDVPLPPAPEILKVITSIEAPLAGALLNVIFALATVYAECN